MATKDVIFLENVGRTRVLGSRGPVPSGYMRNYLGPRHKAIVATKENIQEIEAKRAELEKLAQVKLQAAQARANALSELSLSIPAKVASESRLYGSVGTHDIAKAINDKGIKVEKSEISLMNGPLRELGQHEVLVKLHQDVSVTLKIMIVPSV